jgi:hypothetical protein
VDQLKCLLPVLLASSWLHVDLVGFQSPTLTSLLQKSQESLKKGQQLLAGNVVLQKKTEVAIPAFSRCAIKVVLL